MRKIKSFKTADRMTFWPVIRVVWSQCDVTMSSMFRPLIGHRTLVSAVEVSTRFYHQAGLQSSLTPWPTVTCCCYSRVRGHVSRYHTAAVSAEDQRRTKPQRWNSWRKGTSSSSSTTFSIYFSSFISLLLHLVLLLLLLLNFFCALSPSALLPLLYTPPILSLSIYSSSHPPPPPLCPPPAVIYYP